MKKFLKSALLLLCTLSVLFQMGCTRSFDATSYVQAMLGLSFQGDVKKAMEVMDDATVGTLNEQHLQFINTFVDHNIANEIELGELKRSQFSELVAKIFSTMRYDVGEAVKVGKREYEVPVKIQPSNVFKRFQDRITQDSLKIAEKVRKGGYTGTEEEIQKQVMQDIVNHSYELLELSYLDAQYEKSQTVKLTVKAEKGKAYAVDEKDMEKLVVKILQLDEIQG